MDDLFWTETALNDLDDIGSYIALDSPKASEKTVRRIVESVSGLTDHPKLGRASLRGDGTRELVVSGTPYVAVYRLRTRIEILTIFHGSRRWPEGFE